MSASLPATNTSTPLRRVRCALHIHTAYDGVGEEMPRILEHAREAGVECLLITDHDKTLAAAEGWQGWHDGILVIVGTELRTRDRFDILGLGAHVKVASQSLDRQQTIHLMKRIDMTSFAAHPEGTARVFTGKIRNTWHDLTAHTCDGMEVWNYMVDWMRSFRPWRLNAMCQHPEAYIHGPSAEVLAQWDELAAKRAIGGIGSLDSHALNPSALVKKLFPASAAGILPYQQNFRALSHYVLVPAANWGTSAVHDVLAVTKALKTGEGWFCREELASGKEFVFEATADAQCFPCGSRNVPLSGAMLHMSIPDMFSSKNAIDPTTEATDNQMQEKVTFRIIGNGNVVAEGAGRTWRGTPEEPGVYRVECWFEGKPWLFSNHIHFKNT